MSGYSGTPLPKKLGIREGHRVAAVAAPRRLAEILVPWPSGAQLEGVDEVTGLASAEGRFDVILLFAGAGAGAGADDAASPDDATSPDDGIADAIAGVSDRLEVDGGLWVAWAKMKSPLFSGLKDSHVREAGLRVGLVDNKVCALDDDWSGLRFVFRREDRARVRAERGEGTP
ncbi:DUF3052 domain-containing protein [Gemmatimonadota bacterium DH-20]|uniref:DUF3052 domain-containing protein n=1 Tax=Gaopeijia maritima TaxID=3119007 RepID=A0ABU9E7V1_9BACT